MLYSTCMTSNTVNRLFNEFDPSTWGYAPAGYIYAPATWDAGTGEEQFYAPDGRNLTQLYYAVQALRSTLLLNITTDRSDQNMPLEVVDITHHHDSKFCPEDIGTIEVQYNTCGWRAIYGFTAEGAVQCYAD